MNMTEKNGQPSMEEILASIRRIISEEPTSYPHNGELRGTPIVLKGDSALEDASDFDLPAIFRASPPPQVERSAPLLGRLTDAIRNATTASPEGRAALSADEAQGAEHAGAGEGGISGLSSLKSVRSEASSERAGLFNGKPGPAGAGSEPSPASSPAKPDDEPKRVMAPFKDTHFVHMSSTPAPQTSPSPFPAFVPPPAAAAPAEKPKAPDFGTIIPGEFDRASLSTTPVQRAASVTMPPPPLPTAEPVRNASDQVPPVSADQTGTIEDATADLLRPMLRQWLADNMPRMVEKALHIEIAESVKVPKKL
jgi:cell pole-organizing protein PopZ